MKITVTSNETIEIKNAERVRKFGFGWSTQPTGQGTDIEMPLKPDYEGTVRQILAARDSDPAYQAYGRPSASNYKSTCWFYGALPIQSIWRTGYLKRVADLPYLDDMESPGAYHQWRDRNDEHHFQNDVIGAGWFYFSEDDLPLLTGEIKLKLIKGF